MRSRDFTGKFGLVVRSILSIALIGGLGYQIGSAEILARMKSVRWEIMSLAVVILASNVLIVTPRWAIILGVLGYRIPSASLIRSVFLGFLFNQLLPTVVGGDVVRAWRASQLGVPVDVAIHSVLIDRAAGVLASFAGVATLLPFAESSASRSLNWIVGAFIVTSLVGLLALWGLGRLRILPIPLIGELQRRFAGFNRSAWMLATNPGASLSVFTLAIVNQLLPVAAIGLFTNELHTALAPIDVTLITFVSSLAATIPISVAGWGVREGALVYLCGLYGVPPDVAFTVSILLGFALTLSAAPGVLMLLQGQPMPPPAETR